MPNQSPTDITTTTSTTVQTTATGAYTGELQHVIIGGVDWLIVDGDANSVSIYKLNPTTGALITTGGSPQNLTWTVVAGEQEQGVHDEYQFFTNTTTGQVVGFEADATGVTTLSYNQTSQIWSASYDPNTSANTIGVHHPNYGVFTPFMADDGNLYAYTGAQSSQTFAKYQFNWTTNSWTDTGTSFTGTALGSVNQTDPNQYYGDVMTSAKDGSMYMMTSSGTFYNVYKIDPANGNLIASTPHVRLPVATYGSQLTSDIRMDPNGNIIIANETGLRVFDPATGASVFSDPAGGTGGTSFFADGDLTFGSGDQAGYVYYTSRSGTIGFRPMTQVYQIDPVTGAWSFVAQGQDADATISWTGYVNGSTDDMNTLVTKLSSGVNMIYTGLEQTTGGPITLVTGTIATIGELPEAPLCFVAGTLIRTEHGEVAVEALKVGDLVETLDHGLQPVRWIGGNRHVAQGNKAPIRIRKGALGNSRDLRVSPQHRMLITGWQAELLFGEAEVLVAAKHLVNDQTIRAEEGGTVDYFHVLFDNHEIIFSEGVASESFHPGATSEGIMNPEQVEEIMTLFPELNGRFENYAAAARPSLKAYEGRVLAGWAL